MLERNTAVRWRKDTECQAGSLSELTPEEGSVSGCKLCAIPIISIEAIIS